jgi:CheY-like chemotaxis protein
MDNTSDKSILIVDDKTENISLLSAIFKKYGYKYLSTQSGEESIKIMKTNSNIGLVLMDVKMSGITGTDAMKTIKETSSVPVIAVTGLATETNRKNLIAEGFDDYISKPIDIQLLITKVKALL